MDETRRTVTYGREILTTQVNFRENQKIHLIVTDENAPAFIISLLYGDELLLAQRTPNLTVRRWKAPVLCHYHQYHRTQAGQFHRTDCPRP